MAILETPALKIGPDSLSESGYGCGEEHSPGSGYHRGFYEQASHASTVASAVEGDAPPWSAVPPRNRQTGPTNFVSGIDALPQLTTIRVHHPQVNVGELTGRPRATYSHRKKYRFQEQLREQAMGHEEEMMKFQEEKQSLEATKGFFNSVKRELRQDNSNLHAERQRAQMRIQQLKDRADSQAQKAVEFDHVQARNKFLEEDLSTLKQMQTLQTEQMRGFAAEKLQLTQQIDNLESENRLLVQDKDHLEKNVERLEAELRRQTASVEELTSRVIEIKDKKRLLAHKLDLEKNSNDRDLKTQADVEIRRIEEKARLELQDVRARLTEIHEKEVQLLKDRAEVATQKIEHLEKKCEASDAAYQVRPRAFGQNTRHHHRTGKTLAEKLEERPKQRGHGASSRPLSNFILTEKIRKRESVLHTVPGPEVLVEYQNVQSQLREEILELTAEVKMRSFENERLSLTCDDSARTKAKLELENEMLQKKIDVLREEVISLQKRSSEESARDRVELVLLREKVAAFERTEDEVDAALNFLASYGCDATEREERGRDSEDATALPTPAARRLQESLYLARKLRSKNMELQTAQEQLQEAEKRIAHLERESYVLREAVDNQHRPQSWLQSRLRDKEVELLSTREELQEAREALENHKKLLEKALEEKTRLTMEVKEIQETRSLLAALKRAVLERKRDRRIRSTLATGTVLSDPRARRHRFPSANPLGRLLDASRSSSKRRHSVLKSLLQRLVDGHPSLGGAESDGLFPRQNTFSRDWESRKDRRFAWGLSSQPSSRQAAEKGERQESFLPPRENPLPIVIGDSEALHGADLALPIFGRSSLLFGHDGNGAPPKSIRLLPSRSARPNATLPFPGKRQRARSASPETESRQTPSRSLRGAKTPERVSSSKAPTTHAVGQKESSLSELERTAEKRERGALRIETPEKSAPSAQALDRDTRLAVPLTDKENFALTGAGSSRAR
ncbi:putative myosin heavy chain [Neospora caninum Liverpool]|uniref:Putative myosin heavy chain n=1 Tax=Neospora caninum (strain Liverpool) TaxID=572307 RepID=F0VAV3_NEOCL|nr:putative myosin heavy chain [Neospora caninum Liverpool]CBZ50811.1 putative myosin heavy chain [Neospora caninum Liverpool]|eukprot:XP_003880844.1 putative myosin heavy chain [Neospora caninum Liverpool]